MCYGIPVFPAPGKQRQQDCDWGQHGDIARISKGTSKPMNNYNIKTRTKQTFQEGVAEHVGRC